MAAYVSDTGQRVMVQQGDIFLNKHKIDAVGILCYIIFINAQRHYSRLDRMVTMLIQGARSAVSVVKYNGIDCVQKHYDDRKNSKATKIKNELMFYQRYINLDIIPKLIATDGVDKIWIARREGVRHIELVHEGIDARRNDAISFDYGRKAAAFLNFDRAAPYNFKFDLDAYMASKIDLIQDLQVLNPHHYTVYKTHFEDYIKPLFQFKDKSWLSPMVSKVDFSSTNFFVTDCNVSCIFDFDTAYIGNRLLFIGDIMRSCLHLNGMLTKRGLLEVAEYLPPDEIICGAALLCMLSYTIRKGRDEPITYPDPDLFMSRAKAIIQHTCSK